MGHRSRLPYFSRSPKPPKYRPTTSIAERTEPPSSAPVDGNAVSQVPPLPTRQESTPSLWKKAYEQLDADLIKQFAEILHQEAPSLDSSETAPKDPTRDDVDRICQDGQRRMEQAKTTFLFKNKEHKAHDVFVKGLAVITWAKDLVSTALSAASSPEASLAWAATILVLPLFENINTVKEANKTGFVYVTASMKFYIALETEFRSLSPCVSQDLVDATDESIVELYRTILTFQLRSAIRFNRNKSKNKLRDVVDYDGWKELLQDVKDAENLVNRRWELLQSTLGCGSLHDLREEADRKFSVLQNHLEELKNIDQNTDEMVEMMKRSETRTVTEAEQKCLQALRHHSTTQDQSYELAKDHPGCGKSVLSRYLIEEGLPQGNPAICYFFFKDEDQDRVHLALCALLHQLLVSKLFLITKYLAAEHSRNGESLKTNGVVLWRIFENALRDVRTGQAIIVVDGLDECKPGELGDFCNKVISLFSDQDSAPQTRFIITTRPYPQITSRFKTPHIRVAGELESCTIREEIKLVIQHRVQTLEKMPEIIPSALLPQLKERLLSVDHPTYLWVALTFRYIESGKFKKTFRGIYEAIERLPRTINEAYEKILRKTDPEDEAIVRRALTIVLGAKRPMSIDEMNVALNLAPNMDSLEELDLESEDVFATSLRNWTGLFITIYNGHVYFLRQTVREFLVGDSLNPNFNTQERGRWHGAFSHCEANKMLANIYLQYIPLCYDHFNHTSSIDTMKTPIARMFISAMNWIIDHIMEICNGPSELLSKASLLLTHRAFINSRNHNGETPLFFANVKQLVIIFISAGADIEARNNSGITPLHYAARENNEEVAALLISHGADINTQSQNGSTPLHCAARGDSREVAALLVSSGAHVFAVDYAGQTPLMIADMEKSQEVKHLLSGLRTQRSAADTQRQ